MQQRITVALTFISITAVAISGCSTGNSDASVTGNFAVLEHAASHHSAASGTATLSAFGKGTDIDLTLTGLWPSTKYMAHIHDGECTDNPAGGAHWKAKPEVTATGNETTTNDASVKAATVANEVHIVLHSYADGTVHTSTHSPHQMDNRMATVVVHLAEADKHDITNDRILCADISE